MATEESRAQKMGPWQPGFDERSLRSRGVSGRFKVAAAGARGQAGSGLCYLISSWGMMQVVPQNRGWTCMEGFSGPAEHAELLTLHQPWKAWHPILRAGTPFPKTPKPQTPKPYHVQEEISQPQPLVSRNTSNRLNG